MRLGKLNTNNGPARHPIVPFLCAAVVAMAIILADADAMDESRMPDLGDVSGWVNSVALTRKLLRGKVVLVNFWTYSCINSLRELPYMKAWAAKYKGAGLVVIGVHAPEFSFEKNVDNVKTAVAALKIGYPVAIDSAHSIWNSFHNEYWPADYLIDGTATFAIATSGKASTTAPNE